MKTQDPAIDRIRQARHEISKECDHDPKKLVAHYIEYQKQFEDQLIRGRQTLHAARQAYRPDMKHHASDTVGREERASRRVTD